MPNGRNFFLGKHRVRATFYHVTALFALTVIILNQLSIIDDKPALYITLGLFIVDYVAEMFDPHPTNPGPWYKRYFHRAFNTERVE